MEIRFKGPGIRISCHCWFLHVPTPPFCCPEDTKEDAYNHGERQHKHAQTKWQPQLCIFSETTPRPELRRAHLLCWLRPEFSIAAMCFELKSDSKEDEEFRAAV